VGLRVIDVAEVSVSCVRQVLSGPPGTISTLVICERVREHGVTTGEVRVAPVSDVGGRTAVTT
jgi:hypothetical protein